jgi:hypothetical protein
MDVKEGLTGLTYMLEQQLVNLSNKLSIEYSKVLDLAPKSDTKKQRRLKVISDNNKLKNIKNNLDILKGKYKIEDFQLFMEENNYSKNAMKANGEITFQRSKKFLKIEDMLPTRISELNIDMLDNFLPSFIKEIVEIELKEEKKVIEDISIEDAMITNMDELKEIILNMKSSNSQAQRMIELISNLNKKLKNHDTKKDNAEKLFNDIEYLYGNYSETEMLQENNVLAGLSQEDLIVLYSLLGNTENLQKRVINNVVTSANTESGKEKDFQEEEKEFKSNIANLRKSIKIQYNEEKIANRKNNTVTGIFK